MNVRVWLMIGVLIFGVRFGLPVAYDVPPKVSSLYRLSLLASIVLFLSICCIAINVINLLPVFNLILPNVLTLFQRHLGHSALPRLRCQLCRSSTTSLC